MLVSRFLFPALLITLFRPFSHPHSHPVYDASLFSPLRVTMTDVLLSNQGPLATVWLAANYDKKLLKSQLLQTDIVQLTEIITNNHITLRVLGQLLLGIVRIYSRKTKYLLDDVNDILMKLRTSFKYSTGSRLGSDGTLVNLPASQTVVKNIKLVTLADLVSRYDLFYQPDLNLDLPQIFSSTSQYDLTQNDTQYEDHLMEIGRDEPDENPILDFDIDLDMNDDMPPQMDDEFDMNDDVPEVEVGRRELVVLAPDMSILDVKEPPLETVGNIEPEQVPAPRRPRRRADTSTVAKRRLVVDLETVIPIDRLREFQTSTMLAVGGRHINATTRLEEIYAKAFKRRRIQTESLLMPSIEPIDDAVDDFLDQPALDFELDLPDIDPLAPENDQDNEPVDYAEPIPFSDGSVTSSTPIGEVVEAVLETQSLTTLSEIIVRTSESSTPLRRHAAKCFFDMLALATNDKICLDQTPTNTLGGAITISAN